MANSRNPFLNTASTLGKIGAFLIVAVICGVLTAGLMIPLTAALGSATTGSIQGFDSLPSELKKNAPFQQSKILDRDGGLIATIGTQNRQVVGNNDISPFMKNALVSIEDNRFYEHGGVDPRGIAAALYGAVVNPGGAVRGASTITQQYVKNVLINDRIQSGATPEDIGYQVRSDVGDKIKEARLAIAVEKEMSKDDILTSYLNLVPFSGDAFGVQAASKYFFNTTAKDLTLPQAAVLAGVVNGVSAFSPIAHPDAALARRNLVLDAMLKYGKINQQQHDDAVKTPLALDVQTPKMNCFSAVRAPNFCDYVVNYFKGDKAYGATDDDRMKVLNSGLTIKTTLDPVAQDAAQNQLEQAANPDPSQTNPDIGASVVSVLPGQGDIVVMAQNKPYSADPKDLSATTLNYNSPEFNNGDPNWQLSNGASGFQPGSSFKPYTIATWLKSGRGLNENVNATIRAYPQGTAIKASCLPGGNYVITDEGGWRPTNYDSTFSGIMSVVFGLKVSANSATIAEAAQLDLCDIMNTAADAGATQGSWNASYKGGAEVGTTNATLTRAVQPTFPAVLGSGNVAPLSQATGFATFDADGLKCDPRAILDITTADGQHLPVTPKNCEQVMPKEIAQGTRYAMQQVTSPGGSGAAATALGVPIAGKTGTADRSLQTWFVGFTSGLSTAVWMGNVKAGDASNPDNVWSDNPAFPVGGRVRYNADGSTTALPIWLGYMQDIKGRYAADDFPQPPQQMLTGAAAAAAQIPDQPQSPQPPQPSAPAPSVAPAPSPSNNPNERGNRGNGR